MADTILTLNAGSSSLKFSLYECAGSLALSSHGQIENIGVSPSFRARDSSGAMLMERDWQGRPVPTYEDLIGELLDWVDGHLGKDRLVAVGHRIVHGGREFTAPVRLDERIMVALEGLAPLAPLHQPHNLAAIRAMAKLRRGLLQVGCFDTAFHATIAPTEARFALPRDLENAGVRRYGFHGISYEYIAGRLKEVAPALAEKRVIVAHLGNGASLCALRDGKSVDTTMGLTALDGLVMGTRCGAIDPGVLLYLLQQRNMKVAEIEDLLYCRSGLLGVSGISSDMRTLLASADPHAAEAVDLFVSQAARQIAALAATLGGLDGLIFTAGIGENAPAIRERICLRAAWMGIALDPVANRAGSPLISTPQSSVAVWIIPTDEELMIARHTSAFIA
jgi:acetate kinase